MTHKGLSAQLTTAHPAHTIPRTKPVGDNSLHASSEALGLCCCIATTPNQPWSGQLHNMLAAAVNAKAKLSTEYNQQTLPLIVQAAPEQLQLMLHGQLLWLPAATAAQLATAMLC